MTINEEQHSVPGEVPITAGTSGVGWIGRLAEEYGNYPTIQALLQLIPKWAVADTLLRHKLIGIEVARTRHFFDQLAQGRFELTQDLIETEDFLHCFFATYRAAVNTRQKEKIRMFARFRCI